MPHLGLSTSIHPRIFTDVFFFSNAVELIVSIIALIHSEVLIVKTSMIGSMLSNLLLVTGMCFFFGGLRRTEQVFNQNVATTAAGLLMFAFAVITIPTAFQLFNIPTDFRVAEISRGTSVIFLVVYGSYIYFQLKTDSATYSPESPNVAMNFLGHTTRQDDIDMTSLASGGALQTHQDRLPRSELSQDEQQTTANQKKADLPRLHTWVAVLTLAVSTGLAGVCAEFMVDSIKAITDSGSVSGEFMGLILIPIVGTQSSMQLPSPQPARIRWIWQLASLLIPASKLFFSCSPSV